jgi:hypothetical protein
MIDNGTKIKVYIRISINIYKSIVLYLDGIMVRRCLDNGIQIIVYE